jgi:ABC-type sulfate transport system substrate-binding protein
MMTNNDVCLLESVGEVEEDWHTNLTSNVLPLIATIAISLSNVKNVHVYTRIDVVFIEVMQLASIQVQIATWKPHN